MIVNAEKKEKTIRSETTKVFFVIFAVLIAIGSFTVFATNKGAHTFTQINNHVKDYMAAENLKQRSLEIIGIFYLLGSNQELDILMGELQRYDGLALQFTESLRELKLAVEKDLPPNTQKTAYTLIAETEEIYNRLNDNGRMMMISIMSGKKKEGSEASRKVQLDISQFKSHIDNIEIIFIDQMQFESRKAQRILKNTTMYGIVITLLGVFVTLLLIYYLMNFLSISLLPISNLMHNLRQAVFSIDKTTKIIAPVSKYSSTVFGDSILNKDLLSILFKDPKAKDEIIGRMKFVMKAVFGEGEAQWILSEGYLPKELNVGTPDGNKILRLSYTPLADHHKKIQNIMIVAEDITEVVALKESTSKKEGELSVIKAFMSMKRSEIVPLLKDFTDKLATCARLLPSIETNLSSRIALPRVLHTIKGNARMYYFDEIAEQVHMVENLVIEFNQSFEEENLPDDEQVVIIKYRISQLEAILSYYYGVANRLLGSSTHLESRRNHSVASLCRNMGEMAQRLAEGLNKEIEFKVIGEDFDLDQLKLQIVKDALVHMIRNSIDHGIEERPIREKLGKKQKADLIIECKREGNFASISIRDDGRGIDVDKVITKAIAMKAIKPEDVRKLSETEKLALIFLPNLSTKDSATTISGRGVGMDAVKGFADILGGLITIQTKQNMGTEFTLTFPR
jgi:signal transduction histidine kinase